MRQRVTFSTEDFLRSTPPDLLTKFLEMLHRDHSDSGAAATRLLQQLLKAVKREAPHGRHVPAMLELLRKSRDLSRLVEGPLKCVNDFDSPRGRACMQRTIAELDGAVDPETDFISAGMRLMISHADMFRRLLAIYQVEQTVDWRMYRGRQPGDVDISQDDADALAADFAHALRKQGDSGRCVPTVYRQSERVIVEIAHESYAEALREFRGNDIEVDWRRPVHHARLVYRPSTGLLKVKVHGNDEGLAHLLVSRAGHHMFGDEGHFCENGAQAWFDLDSLKAKPVLPIDKRDQVESVHIIGLQLKLVGVRGAFARYTALGEDLTIEMPMGLPAPDLELDLVTDRARWRGTELEISDLDFMVLEELANTPNSAVTKSQLCHAGGLVREEEDMRKSIMHLRDALTGADQAMDRKRAFEIIKTVPRTGYKLGLKPEQVRLHSVTPNSPLD